MNGVVTVETFRLHALECLGGCGVPFSNLRLDGRVNDRMYAG
jgi:hypothetical protein